MSGPIPATRDRWRHRLPHWKVSDRPHFITIRCAGSLPPDVLARVREIHTHLRLAEPASPQFATLQRQYFSTCEKHLDRQEGFAPVTSAPQDSTANVLLTAWRDLAPTSGWLVTHAVVMPNHVHFIMAPNRESPAPLRTTLREWKGRVARQANLALGRTGKFWQSDWFDRWLRTDAEEARVIAYIQQNPVKAGLVRQWTDWPHRISSPTPATTP
jgi:putative transposase